MAPAGAPAAMTAFSMGDAGTVERTLDAAGFAGVVLAEVNRPVYYGPDASVALDFVLGFSNVCDALGRLDPALAQRGRDRLRAVMAAHLAPDGVWFDSRAWIVSARRA